MKNTTSFLTEIKKAKNLKSLLESAASGKFVASNPKTLRRWKRAWNNRCNSLGLKAAPTLDFEPA